MKKFNNRGFSAVEAILIIIVLAAISGIGYYVYSHKDKATVTTQQSNADETEDLTWTEGGFAVAGTYADADVVQISDAKWRMYYGIQPEVSGNNLEVYSSTSTDGKTWTRETGTRKSMATFPDVVKLKDGRYRMYYQNAGVIKSAISPDGLSFTNESGTRIDTSNSVGLTFDNVAAPTVAQLDDGSYVMVYRGTINTRYAANTPNPSTQLLMWASSTDGLSFTKKGIAVDSRNDTLNGQLDGPDLVKWDDGKYRVFATTYTGVYEFSFDGTTFGEPSLALAGEAKKTNQGFTGSPPGDPSTAKINDVWYMYYGGPHEQNGIHYATLIQSKD
jgi:hypothetical protein